MCIWNAGNDKIPRLPKILFDSQSDRMQIENVEDLQLNQISIFYSEKG